MPIVAASAPWVLGENALKKYSANNNTGARYKLLTGGRGTGKTNFITWLCVTLTYAKGKSNVLYLRYTMTDARQTIAQDVNSVLESMGVAANFYTEQKDGFKFVNAQTGNYILIRGVKAQTLNQTANVKGLNDFANVVIDEAEEFTNEEVFDKLDFSIRQTGINNIIISLNPTTRTHFIYKRWIKGSKDIKVIEGTPVEVSSSKDVLHVHTTYHNLPRAFLAESWLNNVKRLKESDPKKYAHVIIGQWRDVAQGAIFNFSTYRALEPAGVSCLALDVGTRNATVLLKITMSDGRLYVRELWHKSNTTPNERIEKISSLASLHGLPLVSDHDPDTINELKQRGLDVHYADKRVSIGINVMQDYELFLHEDGEKTIDEFSRYRYREGSEDPLKVDDHSCDAARYGCMFLAGLSAQNNKTKRKTVFRRSGGRWREN